MLLYSSFPPICAKASGRKPLPDSLQVASEEDNAVQSHHLRLLRFDCIAQRKWRSGDCQLRGATSATFIAGSMRPFT